jgi:hypothetical protein
VGSGALRRAATPDLAHHPVRQAAALSRFDGEGAFAGFDHDHFFEATEEGYLARDVFDFNSPLGPLGWLVDQLVLERYMRRFLEVRMRVLKDLAEHRPGILDGDS